MTAVNMLWGPASVGYIYGTTSALSTQNLDSANTKAVAWVFVVPKDGTISKVGYHLAGKTGTPPQYMAGLTTVDSSGNPTTSMYGGSADTAFTPGTAGWQWITLSTGATAAAGDWAAVRIGTGASSPDGSNYITATYGAFIDGGYATRYWYSWGAQAAASLQAIEYNDGSVFGCALTTNQPYVTANTGTTPDEVGCKFTLTAALTCYGARVNIAPGGWAFPSSADIVLYDGSNNVLASTSIPDRYRNYSNPYINVYWDNINLSANTTYRLIVKPSVAGNVVVTKLPMDSAAARAALPYGDKWQWTQRTDAGSWTDTDTAISPMGLWVSDITFSSGGGGGGEFAYIG